MSWARRNPMVSARSSDLSERRTQTFSSILSGLSSQEPPQVLEHPFSTKLLDEPVIDAPVTSVLSSRRYEIRILLMAATGSAVPRRSRRECTPLTISGQFAFRRRVQISAFLGLGIWNGRTALPTTKPIYPSLVTHHVFRLTTSTPSRTVTSTADTRESFATVRFNSWMTAV